MREKRKYKVNWLFCGWMAGDASQPVPKRFGYSANEIQQRERIPSHDILHLKLKFLAERRFSTGYFQGGRDCMESIWLLDQWQRDSPHDSG